MSGTSIRRDSKHRILCKGESIRANGKYQFKYYVDGKPHFVYSWRLEPTDLQPAGKAPCRSLRELEKEIGRDLDSLFDPIGRNMTVNELVERYLKTKTGVKPNTLMNYGFVKNILLKKEFGTRKISRVKTSDAKLFLIKLQQDGKAQAPSKRCGEFSARLFKWRLMMICLLRIHLDSSLQGSFVMTKKQEKQ